MKDVWARGPCLEAFAVALHILPVFVANYIRDALDARKSGMHGNGIWVWEILLG